MTSESNQELTNNIDNELVDLPELYLSTNEKFKQIINEIYGNDLTENTKRTKEAEQKYIVYLDTIAENFGGEIDFTIPGVVFIMFKAKGLKPLNKYNFYFEQNKLRCVNQINFHQESSLMELDMDEINEDTLVDDIINHITSIKLYQTKETRGFTKEQYDEFSNPF